MRNPMLRDPSQQVRATPPQGVVKDIAGAPIHPHVQLPSLPGPSGTCARFWPVCRGYGRCRRKYDRRHNFNNT
jgi:hypothetical protein